MGLHFDIGPDTHACMERVARVPQESSFPFRHLMCRHLGAFGHTLVTACVLGKVLPAAICREPAPEPPVWNVTIPYLMGLSQGQLYRM